MDLKEKIESSIKKSFTVSYKDIETNKAIKDAFVNFCYMETDGNYLQGIRLLLENYSSDWKYESLKAQLDELRIEIENLKKQPIQEKEKKRVKTFGGNVR